MLSTKFLLVIIRHQYFGDTLASICDNKYLRVVSEANLVEIFCHQNQNKGSQGSRTKMSEKFLNILDFFVLEVPKCQKK